MPLVECVDLDGLFPDYGDFADHEWDRWLRVNLPPNPDTRQGFQGNRHTFGVCCGPQASERCPSARVEPVATHMEHRMTGAELVELRDTEWLDQRAEEGGMFR